MKSKIAISVRGVTKKFRLFSSPKERLIEALHPFRKQYHREFLALQGVSFDICRGEIVGILGRNGSGKSTLLQIICSVMQPTHGEVVVNGRISALLELGAGFNPEFTGRENVVLNGAIMGIARGEMLRRMQEIEAFADIGEFFDQPVKTYSSGMYVRVAFAAAIHVDPEILIVDEALSVGDSRFQHRCYQKIRAYMEQGKTILVVSHATDTLLRICHRGVVIDAGRVVHVGPISEAVTHYHALLFGNQVPRQETVDSLEQPAEVKSRVVVGQRHILTSDPTDYTASRAAYNPHETRMGSGAVGLVDFEIVVGDMIDPPEIPKHAEVELLVKLHFRESLERVSFGFALVSVDGTYIAGTNSEMAEGPYLTAAAGECVLVRLHWRSHVVGGEYFLNIGCHHVQAGEKTFLDVRRALAKLKFTDTPGCYGFVNLEYVAKVQRLTATQLVAE
ncbi:ABC transporter related [Candidatus Nitrospira nitrosa]|uniref:ABC transporter related n=1 Tax=Candidatus Nitrospira nitrosa TaxID=1742972 RepID=A0A0S4LDX1_9BACT|nr:ABC transporter ATP-binding protein [Candidatus Nitrospira nitrosa]CUS35086.1 ABC transporter related [Candidatus Nitrospira nitrosa]